LGWDQARRQFVTRCRDRAKQMFARLVHCHVVFVMLVPSQCQDRYDIVRPRVTSACSSWSNKTQGVQNMKTTFLGVGTTIQP
jgi:hypothetical protein